MSHKVISPLLAHFDVGPYPDLRRIVRPTDTARDKSDFLVYLTPIQLRHRSLEGKLTIIRIMFC